MATNTYVALSTTTLTSNVTTVTLNSIPQGYTDLVLVMQPASSSGTNGIRMRINGDTNAYYSATYMAGNGSSAVSSRNSNEINMQVSNYIGIDTTLGKQVYTLHFMDYANSARNKTVLMRNNAAAGAVELAAGMWRSTAAITSLSFNINTFGSSTGDFITGSTFTLYGISDAGDIGTKAIGGDVYTDSTYVYHAFPMSGRFTPTEAITADILVVAGGGGGGGATYEGGGGGAGGVLAFASQSLTTTNYSVTIGAGGNGGANASRGSNGTNSQFAALTASVGGGGGGNRNSANGASGGSGGGGTYNGGSGGAGTSGQGYAGGSWVGGGGEGAGGGGAGSAGSNNTPNTKAGDGGAGVNTVTNWGALSSVLTATTLGVSGYIAGGGGGGANGAPNIIGTGGAGGGGNGNVTGAGVNAIASTGSGGGGAGGSASAIGGNGASGLVIIRYPK